MKRAILLMTDQFVLQFLKATLMSDRRIVSIVKNALPNDVKIVRFGYDGNGTLRFMLESESFEDIPDNKPYPELPAPHIKVEIV